MNPVSHYDFCECITKSLCGVPAPRTATPTGGGRLSQSGINVEHRFVRIDSVCQCVYCNIVHKKNFHTTRMCGECNVHLFPILRLFNEMASQKLCSNQRRWLRAKPSGSSCRGRPKGNTISKGRGKRKRKNW